MDLQIDYLSCPSFVPGEPYNSSLIPGEIEDEPAFRGLRNVAEREFFRQLRRHLKKQWRSQFRAIPSMRYETYKERVEKINQIGRNTDPISEINGDYFSSQVREDLFHRSEEGEEEIPVIRWGPLVVSDSGSLHFDPSVITQIFLGNKDSEELTVDPEIGPEPKTMHRPLFSGKGYRLHTRFRLNLNPLKILDQGDPAEAFRSYGMVFEVTWLTDILRRERFVTECEAQYERDGEVTFFFNFVVKSR